MEMEIWDGHDLEELNAFPADQLDPPDLDLWQPSAEDGANGRPPELPGINNQVYARPDQAKKRLGKSKKKKKPLPQREEQLKGKNPNIKQQVLGYGASIVGMIGWMTQMLKPKSTTRNCLIGVFMATLFIGAATYFSALNPSWNVPDEVISFICVMVLVAALQFAIQPCIEFVKNLKELLQHLGELIMANPLSIWLMNTLGFRVTNGQPR